MILMSLRLRHHPDGGQDLYDRRPHKPGRGHVTLRENSQSAALVDLDLQERIPALGPESHMEGNCIPEARILEF